MLYYQKEIRPNNPRFQIDAYKTTLSANQVAMTKVLANQRATSKDQFENKS